MALESFYGGKQGVSPVIKARFKYINIADPAYTARLGETTKLTKEEAIWLNDALGTSYEKGQSLQWRAAELKPFTMDECLKDVNYTEVWYGELCIIDTDNKMNPNNGKLYRRTLKQVDNKTANTEDTLYAEYIGQIVGPSGGIPRFDFGSLNVERKKAVGKLPTYDTEIEIASETNPLVTSDWDYAYPADESGTISTVNPQGDENQIAELPATPGNTANIQMVPGKVSENEYNDTIKYTWCNVRRKLDSGNIDAWIYLGFEIPYTVYEATGIQENYTYNGDIFTDDSDSDHPFAKAYTFHIPRGARGIGPEWLYIVGKDGNTRPKSLYNFDAITYNPDTDTYFVDNNKKIEEGKPSEKTYWVAKWRLYNPKTSDITDVYQYIGAYKDVKEVRLLDEGNLQIQYSDKDTDNDWYDLGTLTWITSASAILETTNVNNNEYGKLKINIAFNNKNKVPNINLEKDLHLIKSVTYDDNSGQITFDYSGDFSKTVGTIKYVKDININTTKENNDYGKVTITTNTGEEKTKILPLIKDTAYEESTGIISFQYAGMENPIETGPLSYVSKMKIEDGTIQYQLNTESGNTWHTVTDGAATNPKVFKIRDIVNTEIYGNVQESAVFNNLENNATPITGHLYVLYRGDTYWTDLGQVKGNAVAGIVYTLQNNTADHTYGSESEALVDLQGKTFDNSALTSIGGNGNGRIKVNGQEETGGLVSASIKEENSDDPYSAIFYYNKENGTWQFAGVIGNATEGSGGGNIAVKGSASTTPSDETMKYPRWYFVDSNSQPSKTVKNINPNDDSIYSYNYQNVLLASDNKFFMPWQNTKANLTITNNSNNG